MNETDDISCQTVPKGWGEWGGRGEKGGGESEEGKKRGYMRVNKPFGEKEK